MFRRTSLLLVAVAFVGCGASPKPAPSATVVLDFTPNAVHSGIYLAQARGYPSDEGVKLHIQAPGSSTDAAITAASDGSSTPLSSPRRDHSSRLQWSSRQAGGAPPESMRSERSPSSATGP